MTQVDELEKTDEQLAQYLKTCAQEAAEARAHWERERKGIREFFGCDDASEAVVIQSASLVVTLLNEMSDDERKHVMWVLHQHFCWDCGRKLNRDGQVRDVCHCTNDE